ncbi:hypothetical protein GCM10008983_09690 [Lentibacillus halophilus]|uniref:SLH domain-containing protein n=1 Tax=Lentibacillus halophilus TaxID=295065 RepID=A0ABP3J053_9BACI
MKRQRVTSVLLLQSAVLLLWSMVLGMPGDASASQSVQEQFPVSKGVQYKDIRLSNGSGEQAVRVTAIDTSRTDTSVEVGFPDGLNKLLTTTSLVMNYHRNDHRVVSAVNASFYHTVPRIPMYLISKDNKLTFAGQQVSSNQNSYVNEPIAFGMNRHGKGMIDDYHLTLNYTYQGKKHKMISANKPRTEDGVTLYTSAFHGNTTQTNQYGMEVVVKTDEKPALTFGSSYQGTVTAVRQYGDTDSADIPENGFVLSAHRKAMGPLDNMEKGDNVSFNVDIDNKWKGSSFMLTSGPMLVKDGHVNLSMNPNSWRARLKAPRTAVAIDESGDTVFFITADGRQSGYAAGMTLSQFAKYAVRLGADRALNLDGGGSTTMDIRYPGYDTVQVANRPSDGRQRGVISALMAVSTSDKPYYLYTDVNRDDTHADGIEWLTKQGIQGYEDGSYGVGKILNRPHAAIMFTNVQNLERPDASAVTDYFKDIEADDLYASYIAAVGQAGIFNGSDGNYMPEKQLTRQQMASTLVSAFDLEKKGDDVDINLSNVAPSHKENVQTLANLGITNQLDDFRPNEPVTRGQFATFLYQSQQN